MVSIEEVEKRFEKKIKWLKEELPQKYHRDTIIQRNCAAYTVLSIMDILDMNDTNIINMAAPLAGITRVCGAVAAGLMMVGMIVGKKGAEEITQFRASTEGMRYLKRFYKEFESIQCPVLTGYDLLTQEGMQNYIKEDVWGKKCYMHIVKTVEIIGKLYKKQIAELIE